MSLEVIAFELLKPESDDSG